MIDYHFVESWGTWFEGIDLVFTWPSSNMVDENATHWASHSLVFAVESCNRWRELHDRFEQRERVREMTGECNAQKRGERRIKPKVMGSRDGIQYTINSIAGQSDVAKAKQQGLIRKNTEGSHLI